MNWLEIGANIASILTAFVAVVVSVSYAVDRSIKRRKVEDYLIGERDANPRRYGPNDHGRRSTMHLVAAMKIPEDEILHAAFRSKKIKASPATGAGTTRADAIWLEAK